MCGLRHEARHELRVAPRLLEKGAQQFRVSRQGAGLELLLQEERLHLRQLLRLPSRLLQHLADEHERGVARQQLQLEAAQVAFDGFA